MSSNNQVLHPESGWCFFFCCFSSASRSCDRRQEVGFSAPGERNEGHFLPLFAAGLRLLLSPVRERPVAPSRTPAEGGGYGLDKDPAVFVPAAEELSA